MKASGASYPFSQGFVKKRQKKTPVKKEAGKVKKSKSFSLPTFLKPGTRIEIEGFNQNRLWNELRQAGVESGQIDKQSPSKAAFTVPEKDTAKTFAILEKLCYTYTVVKRVSLGTFGRFLLQKAALIAALVAAVALGIYAYGFVWRVEITGCQKTESAAIERFLQENGFSAGARKERMDFTKIRSLVNSLDDVLESSIQLQGITLKIEVTETTDYTVPLPGSETGIYSRYDAEVTRIVAESGTPLVGRGSRVFKGKALIGAYRLDKEEKQVPVLAKGRIYGIVTFTDSADFSLKETVSTRTGKKSVKTDISFFGLSIKGKEKHGFAEYESTTESVYAFENFFIPVRTARTVYYETAGTETVYDLNERTEFFIGKAVAAHALELGSSAFEIKTRLEQTGEFTYRLHTFIQAELLIGEN